MHTCTHRQWMRTPVLKQAKAPCMRSPCHLTSRHPRTFEHPATKQAPEHKCVLYFVGLVTPCECASCSALHRLLDQKCMRVHALVATQCIRPPATLHARALLVRQRPCRDQLHMRALLAKAPAWWAPATSVCIRNPSAAAAPPHPHRHPTTRASSST